MVSSNSILILLIYGGEGQLNSRKGIKRQTRWGLRGAEREMQSTKAKIESYPVPNHLATKTDLSQQ